MAELKLILITYGQFYRRRSGLLLLFFIGLSLGAALLTAIQGLNLEAGKRYQQTTALIANPVTHFVRPVLGENKLPHTLWSRLRVAGFSQAQPVLEGVIETKSKQKLALRGVNLLQWLNVPNTANTAPNNKGNTSIGTLLNTVYVDPKLIQRLTLNNSITVKVGEGLRTLKVTPLQGLGMNMLMDISLADQLLNANGKINYIELSGLTSKQNTQLKALIGDTARLESAQQQAFDALSEAFFFNLQALALLGYVVGAFLSFNAIKLAYNARAHLQQQMWVLGCQKSALIKALVIELALLSFVAAVLGALLGVVLANALVMDVSASLRGLYQLDRSFVVNLNVSMVASGFVLNIIVLLGFLVSQSQVFNAFFVRAKWFMLMLAIVTASYLALTASTKISALLLCGCVLLVFFAITAPVVRAVFNTAWPTQNPIIQWLKADSIVQLPALLSAVLAILMAMGAAVGMQIMVGSFSDTLDTHLEKRLSADLYVRPEQNIDALQRAFNALPDVDKVGVYWSAKSELNTARNTVAVNAMAFGATAEHNQHLTLLNNQALTSTMFEKNESGIIGCLVNEPALLQYQIKRGDVINLKQHMHDLTCQVRAAYYDYGEQGLNVVVTTDGLLQSGFNYTQYGLSLWLNSKSDVDAMAEFIQKEYQLDSQQVIANQAFKRFAKQLFSKTFYVTQALNLFIMLIALFGMWVSFLTLGRGQLQPMAVLQTLGVTQRQLLGAKVLQAAIVILITLLLAIPLGLCLGWVLLTYVMPIAFGWTMAMSINWLQLGVFATLVFILALLVSALPLIKLTRSAVADNVAKL
ncbi:ABC transporter permease [Pseudoalteromonas sp.]|uniref:ABC transporter permease n=1 Tax=Pseudoalteromonas sp. TaxID=53249 RepID=UPI001BD0AFD5|nr:ABC transporter permease [Pseudoalteromonas sp.]